MEFARVLRELSEHRKLLLAGVGVALLAAVLSVYSISGGKLKARSLQHSSATTQVLVDANSSVLGSVSQQSEQLATRAQVFSNLMASPAFLDIIARQVGLSGGQLYAAGPVNANEPRVEQEPTDLKRNVEITGETKPYRLTYESQQNLPTINIFTQAPTTPLAVGLANAAASGLRQYVDTIEAEAGIPTHARIVIRQLGPAQGAVVNGGISKTLFVTVFIAVFVLWCLLVLLGTRFVETWRATAPEPAPQEDAPDTLEFDEPAEVLNGEHVFAAEGVVHEVQGGRDDDLPAVAARGTR
jgi:hypothetical protein